LAGDLLPDQEDLIRPDEMPLVDEILSQAAERLLPVDEVLSLAAARSSLVDETLLPEDEELLPTEELPPPVGDGLMLDFEDIAEVSEETSSIIDSSEDFQLEFLEAIPMEIFPSEEIVPSQEPVDENAESAAGELLESIAANGLYGNLELIEQELESISAACSCGILLVDSDGLVIAGNASEDFKPEITAAYSLTIAQSTKALFEEAGMGNISLIYFEGKTGQIRLIPGRDKYVLLLEEKKAGDVEEDAGALSNEANLREAILKRALEDVVKTDGIEGSILIEKDGPIIESALKGSLDGEMLGYLGSQLFIENAKSLERLPIGQLRQILIKTSGMSLNLIPIESEAIMITCLDSQLPRDVWQGKLPQAAQMIHSVLI
jgi:uncharacterized protein